LKAKLEFKIWISRSHKEKSFNLKKDGRDISPAGKSSDTGTKARRNVGGEYSHRSEKSHKVKRNQQQKRRVE